MTAGHSGVCRLHTASPKLPMPALIPVSLLSPLGPAWPSQFFTCLVILFACEVAAGIWGFVNKDQVSLGHSSGPVPAGLGLGGMGWAYLGLRGALWGCLWALPHRKALEGFLEEMARAEKARPLVSQHQAGVGVGATRSTLGTSPSQESQENMCPLLWDGPCGGCDLTPSAHPTPRSPRT